MALDRPWGHDPRQVSGAADAVALPLQGAGGGVGWFGRFSWVTLYCYHKVEFFLCAGRCSQQLEGTAALILLAHGGHRLHGFVQHARPARDSGEGLSAAHSMWNSSA